MFIFLNKNTNITRYTKPIYRLSIINTYIDIRTSTIIKLLLDFLGVFR